MEYCESIFQMINPNMELTEAEKEIVNILLEENDMIDAIIASYNLKGALADSDVILCRTLALFLNPKYLFGTQKPDEYVLDLYQTLWEMLEEQQANTVKGEPVSYEAIFEIIHKMNIIFYNQKLGLLEDDDKLFISDVDVVPDALIDLFLSDWGILDQNDKLNQDTRKGVTLGKGMAAGVGLAIGGVFGMAAGAAGSIFINKNKMKKSDQLCNSLIYFVTASVLTELRIKNIREDYGNVW